MGTQMNKKYGMPTAISMVVGIVIGSGIFFKADDVLTKTDGNAMLGILGFLIVGIGVIFGALLMSQFALADSSAEGGVVSYAKNTHSKKFGDRFAFAMGWFLTVLYHPCIIVILAFVCALYFVPLVGLDGSNMNTIMMFAALFLAAGYLSNTFAPKFSGGVQSVATIIKIIPLLLIGIVGSLMQADPAAVAAVDVAYDYSKLDDVSSNFLGALIAIAFTFDGWYIATSITSELKNVKKVLPIALVGGTTIVTLIYILYFYGVTNSLDANTIIASGDQHVSIIGNLIFGEFGGKLLTTFVVISVYGGMNGMILSYMRMPHMLVSNNVMKDYFNIKKVNEKFDMPFNSILFGLPSIIIIYILHYLSVVEGNWFNSIGFDISALPILLLYIFFIVLYTGILPKIKNGDVSKIYYIFYLIATFISLLVVYGTIEGVTRGEYLGVFYILFGVVITVFGFLFFYKKEISK